MAVDKRVQLWRTPSLCVEFSPFTLLRTFARHYQRVLSLDWSPDSRLPTNTLDKNVYSTLPRYLATGSEDLSVRIWVIEKSENALPFTLAGHRAPVKAAYHCGDKVFYSAMVHS